MVWGGEAGGITKTIDHTRGEEKYSTAMAKYGMGGAGAGDQFVQGKRKNTGVSSDTKANIEKKLERTIEKRNIPRGGLIVVSGQRNKREKGRKLNRERIIK